MKKASTVPDKLKSQHPHYRMEYQRTVPSLSSVDTSLWREARSPCEIRITLSHRFHHDLATVCHGLQQRRDSFTL